jgi:hypothetical protein
MINKIFLSKMTLTEYQSKTHQYYSYNEEIAKDYFYIELISRIGKLCYLYNQSIIDNKEISKESIIDNLGDIMWCISEIANSTKSKLYIASIGITHEPKYTFKSLIEDIIKTISNMKIGNDFYEYGLIYIIQQIQRLCVFFKLISLSNTEIYISFIIENNIDKLKKL